MNNKEGSKELRLEDANSGAELPDGVKNIKADIANSIISIEDAQYFDNIEASNADRIKGQLLKLLTEHQSGLPEVVVDDLIIGSMIQIKRGANITAGFVKDMIASHQFLVDDDFLFVVIPVLNDLNVDVAFDENEDFDISSFIDPIKKAPFNTGVKAIHGDYFNKLALLDWFVYRWESKPDKRNELEPLSSILRSIPNYQEYLTVDAVRLRDIKFKKAGLTARQYVDGMLTLDTENRRSQIQAIINELLIIADSEPLDFAKVKTEYQKIKDLIYK